METNPTDHPGKRSAPLSVEAGGVGSPPTGIPMLGYAPRGKAGFGHSQLAACIGPTLAAISFVSIVTAGIPEAGHDRIDSGRGRVTGLLLALIAAVVSRFGVHLAGGKLGLAASTVCLLFALL